MPITQDRMLSLLAAAQDYQDAMNRFFALAESTRLQVEVGSLTLDQGFTTLAISLRPELMLQFPFQSPTVIRLEVAHFTRERKRNERKAEKARENREADRHGLPRPLRGDGGQSGILGGKPGMRDRQRRLVIQPDPDVTFSRPATLASPGEATAQPKPETQQTLRNSDSTQVGPDSDLDDLGQGDSEVPVGYVPKTPPPDVVAQLERESREREAAEEYARLYGETRRDEQGRDETGVPAKGKE